MMKASAFEFRIRVWLHAVLIGVGFWAPWNMGQPVGANAHSWGVLAAALAPYVGDIVRAFDLLLVVAIVLATGAALLRTWGAAYLGAGVVQDGAMHAGVVADGPYRYVRNPLYLGTFLHVVALGLLMSRSGAVFAIVTVAVLQVRLILGEEAFLTGQLGEPYREYCAMVPRLLPALRARVNATGRVARWGAAFVAEIYMWGVAGVFAFLGWRYNAGLLMQGVIVSFGAWILVRAVVPGKPEPVVGA